MLVIRETDLESALSQQVEIPTSASQAAPQLLLNQVTALSFEYRRLVKVRYVIKTGAVVFNYICTKLTLYQIEVYK
jgi:hypothetical protein